MFQFSFFIKTDGSGGERRTVEHKMEEYIKKQRCKSLVKSSNSYRRVVQILQYQTSVRPLAVSIWEYCCPECTSLDESSYSSLVVNCELQLGNANASGVCCTGSEDPKFVEFAILNVLLSQETPISTRTRTTTIEIPCVVSSY